MSIRLRLTLQYSGALFAAGLVQLAVLQALVKNSDSVMRNFFGSRREQLRNRLDDFLENTDHMRITLWKTMRELS